MCTRCFFVFTRVLVLVLFCVFCGCSGVSTPVRDEAAAALALHDLAREAQTLWPVLESVGVDQSVINVLTPEQRARLMAKNVEMFFDKTIPVKPYNKNYFFEKIVFLCTAPKNCVDWAITAFCRAHQSVVAALGSDHNIIILGLKVQSAFNHMDDLVISKKFVNPVVMRVLSHPVESFALALQRFGLRIGEVSLD